MYHIHPFQANDLEAYRQMRLEALLTEAGNFGNSYAFEAAFSDDEWSKRLSNPYGCCFGLYRQDELIGITGIVSGADKPAEAYMTQSYIRKAYRGQGLSRMLYEARIAWAKARGISCLIIGHRERNVISKAANQCFGFTYTHQEDRIWPDGVSEPMLYYKLML
ncbi:MAG TPA: GNAT family N-acetyltransferase [Chitinophagaceae bacterium]|nr:GNAT family N-acetyltransferase [Chitinophagaceae bacterium]